MLVRAVSSQQHARSFRVVALFALAVTVARPTELHGQQSTAPKTHTVKRGDTLWDIAKLYLGDSFLWPEIYRQNTDVIEDPHWIYPGEMLKLPGESTKVVAEAPTEAAPAPAPAQPAAAPNIPAAAPPTVHTDSAPAPLVQQARSVVRSGEYAAAPWVDRLGGPKGTGYVIQSAELPGISSADLSRVGAYDRVMVAPPAGAPGAQNELYLTFRLGPILDDIGGQVVIPTGIVRVIRASKPGVAGVAQVVKMFDKVEQGQRLMPYDSNAAIVSGRPSPVSNGASGKVRWVFGEPVLPQIQHYVVLNLSKRDGLTAGDQIELFQPVQKATEGRDLALPEVSIAHAQVLRVTEFGATAIITAQEQAKIEAGTAARVAAKMP